MSLLYKFGLYIRAIIFWLLFAVSTVVLGTLVLLSFILPYKVRYLYKRLWVNFNLVSLKYICGLDYKIEGLENIPSEPTIIFSKHQSTFETLVIVKEFPAMSWVLKRELLWIPFFGWALALLKPTAIDRKSGVQALAQMIKECGKSLQAGFWITIFPEGTRTAPGSKPNYHSGGAMVAVKTGYSVLPIAHNSGEFWPRMSFIKWPGTVTFSIAPVIESKNKKPKEVLTMAQDAIESRMVKISDPTRWNR